MKKFQNWLYTHFLPAVAREKLLAENKQLTRALHDAQQENDRLQAYIDGMHAVLRKKQQIHIHTERW